MPVVEDSMQNETRCVEVAGDHPAIWCDPFGHLWSSNHQHRMKICPRFSRDFEAGVVVVEGALGGALVEDEVDGAVQELAARPVAAANPCQLI